MRILRLIGRHKYLYFLSSLFMLASFLFNIFGVGPGMDWFTNYQKDSQALVVRQISCRALLGHDAFGGMNLKADPKIVDTGSSALTYNEHHTVCQSDGMVANYSQFGLQGLTAEYAYLVTHKVLHLSVSHFLVLAQFALSLITALVLALFVLWVAEEFSLFAAVFSSLMICLSVWIVGYARNLYWVTPLLFLPVIFTLFYYTRPAFNRRYIFFIVGLFILFLLRLLNGYEFTPEIILAPVVALSYLLYKINPSLLQLAKEAVVICVVGGLAFISALGLNFLQTYRYTGSSSKAFHLIESRAFARTADSADYRQYAYLGLQATLPDIYKDINNYVDLSSAAERKPVILTNLVSLVNYALLPVINIPVLLKEPFYTLVNSFTAFALLTWWSIKQLKRKAHKFAKLTYLALNRTLWLGLITSLSWLGLGHAHSLVHAHLAGIIFYLPFALFAYISIGCWLERLYVRLKTRIG